MNCDPKDGGFAFPQVVITNAHGDINIVPTGGMTLRDWFAGQVTDQDLGTIAIDATIYPPNDPYPKDGTGWDYVLWRQRLRARLRYAFADAMLKARNAAP